MDGFYCFPGTPGFDGDVLGLPARLGLLEVFGVEVLGGVEQERSCSMYPLMPAKGGDRPTRHQMVTVIATMARLRDNTTVTVKVSLLTEHPFYRTNAFPNLAKKVRSLRVRSYSRLPK